jgi:hypothetical protein
VKSLGALRFRSQIRRMHLQFITLCIAVLSKGFARLPFTDSQLLSDSFDGLSVRSWVPPQ